MMATALLFFAAGEAFTARASNSAAIAAVSARLCLVAAAGVFGRATGWTRAPPATAEGSLPQISTMPETVSLLEAGDASRGDEKSVGPPCMRMLTQPGSIHSVHLSEPIEAAKAFAAFLTLTEVALRMALARTSSSELPVRVRALYAEPRSGSDGCQCEAYLACRDAVSAPARLACSDGDSERLDRCETRYETAACISAEGDAAMMASKRVVSSFRGVAGVHLG